MSLQNEVEADLQAAVVDGLVELVEREDGSEGYRMTAKGIEHVEAQLRDAGFDPDNMTNHDFADAMGAPDDAPIRKEPERVIGRKAVDGAKPGETT